MPDVCRVKLSRELSLIFRNHYDGVYLLAWYSGLLNVSDNRAEIYNAIYGRFIADDSPVAKNRKLFAGQDDDYKANEKYYERTILFLKDFLKLSFNDIDLLKLALNDVDNMKAGWAVLRSTMPQEITIKKHNLILEV